MSRFDLRTFLLIFGAALLGAAWAVYQRSAAFGLPTDDRLRALVWVIFATPFATFWGWFLARRAERLWAAAICFCIYFFAPFIAARYESCAVVWAQFGPAGCFTATGDARQVANSIGHAIYFQAIVVVHLIAALALAVQRAISPAAAPLPRPEPETVTR